MSALGAAEPPGMRRLPALPAAMLLLSTCGMAVGLAIDCGVTPPDLIATLCVGSAGSLAATIAAHSAFLPATHIGMLAGAILALALDERPDDPGFLRAFVRRLPAGAVSILAMFTGMVLGGWLGPDVAARLGVGSDFAGLIGGMVIGMAAGMLLAAPLVGLARRPAPSSPRKRL